MDKTTIPIPGLETDGTFRVRGAITRGDAFSALVSGSGGDAVVPVGLSDGHWSAGELQPLAGLTGSRVIAGLNERMVVNRVRRSGEPARGALAGYSR